MEEKVFNRSTEVWTVTPELRWRLDRRHTKPRYILQQKWVSSMERDDWRDVPTDLDARDRQND